MGQSLLTTGGAHLGKSQHRELSGGLVGVWEAEGLNRASIARACRKLGTGPSVLSACILGDTKERWGFRQEQGRRGWGRVRLGPRG